MPTILLENKTISLSDIQRCIEAFQSIQEGKESDKKIVVEAKIRIEAIDPLLISYFMLFMQQVKELQIVLSLPYNPIEPENEQLEYQLKQIGTYAYLMTGMSIFQIVFGKLQVKFELQNSTSFPDPRWFVFTSDFFPILFVSENSENFNFLFNDSLNDILKENNLDINKLDEKVSWDKNSNLLRNNYHRHLRETSKPNERKKALLNLARMAFINSLDETKVAHLFFKNYYDKSSFTAKNRIQAGNLQNETAFKYYDEIESVFDELQNSSISHQFFFSTILATEMLRDKGTEKDVLNEATKVSFIKKINSLWGFTKDLVAGIKELSKNIREHSKPSIGAISVRLFRMERWMQIKNLVQTDNNIYSFYQGYLTDRKFTDSDSVIDINVIDVGTIGVVSTLIKNTESVLSSVSTGSSQIKKLIEEDLSNLRSNQIRFYNLLNPLTQQLNQQSKRSIAHFGLLTLSKLVEHNNGLIVASSQSNNDTPKRESLCIPNLISDYVYPIKAGTNYNIVLPINPNQSYTTHLPHKIKLPSETSAKEIKGVEELFNYQAVQLTQLQNDFRFNSSVKYLIEINFEKSILTNREDEDKFWKNFATKFASTNIPTEIKYALCFNFLKVGINESQLFRFLGKCELNFPIIPIIVLNIPNECYQRLIKINGEFHEQNKKLAYWNENISILIYSYQKIKDGKFFFSDVLWGKTLNDFVYLNHLVSLSTPNSTSMLRDKKQIKVLISKVGEVDPNTEMFFLNKNNLLPFELLLQSSDGTTLFEENVLVLLKNELKA